MRIHVEVAVLLKTKWHEYAIRFIFGGAVTAAAGMIAKHYGPIIGGLFLASPAIFPASATLVEKHEEQRKQRLGLNGKARGRQAASIDAAGSAIGSLGLLGFAATSWKFLPYQKPPIVLLVGTLTWLSLSGILWHFRKRQCLLRRK